MRWENIEEIVNSLEENYPEEEVMRLSLIDLEDLIKSLADFEDHDVEADEQILERIKEEWLEIRGE